jgi:hypothetical protein
MFAARTWLNSWDLLVRAVLVLISLVVTIPRLTAQEQNSSKAVGLTAVEQAVAQLKPEIKPPARWAVIIATGDYADDRIPDLPACVRDGEALHAILLDPLRGLFPVDHVKLLKNEAVTREKVIESLEWLRSNAKPDDLALVFLADTEVLIRRASPIGSCKIPASIVYALRLFRS